MQNSKTGRRPRAKLTFQEINETTDKLLQELVLLYKANISYAIQENINIEEDHVSTSLWECVCTRFYRLKDMQREELKLKQERMKLIPTLEELHVMDDKVLHELFD